MGPFLGLLILAIVSFLMGGFLVLTKATGILLLIATISMVSVLCIVSPALLVSILPLVIQFLPMLISIAVLVLILGFGILGGTVSINYVGLLVGLVLMSCSIAIF